MIDDTRIAAAPNDMILSAGAQLDKTLRAVDETACDTSSSRIANSCRSC
ncbi:hypothetical protein [Burkholderia sp. Nafp2/4-1b]|nr:hypothetical protein [Burkholderia sp. Nafp2/4-1b]